jgi:hypothetical protein
LRDSRAHGFTQADFFRVENARFATSQVKSAGPAAERPQHLQHAHRVHAMGVYRLVFEVVEGIKIRFDQINRAGRLALGRCIHEDRHVIAVHHRVAEVIAADAEITHVHPVRQLAADQLVYNLDAECVVPHENIADTGDEDAHA